MQTLIEISRELLELENQLEELADNPEATEEAIAKYLESFTDTISQRDQKLDNYAALIRELEVRSDARKAEAQRLAKRSAIDANKAEALKTHLKKFFEAHELKTIETNRFRLTLAKNGGKLPVILDSQPAENYPEQYRQTVTVTSPNREAIRAALEAGESLNFAHFGDRSYSLRIK